MKLYKLINYIYRLIGKPLLFGFDSEFIHEKTIDILSVIDQKPYLLKMINLITNNQTNFNIKIKNLTFNNPIGLAAGFDKNARIINSISQFGFGFMEVGTITPKPQSGNEKPRLYRLPDDLAVINRMGFNNVGFDAVLNNIIKSKFYKNNFPIGINIGKNKITPIEKAIDDYFCGIETFSNVADYLTINISSPNTPDLRKLQTNNFLNRFLQKIADVANITPIFLKIDPDLSDIELDRIIDISMMNNITGIIATNTTISRNNLLTKNIENIGFGGLSGKPLFEKALRSIKRIYKRSSGKLTIIGVGGVFNSDDAWKMIVSGASLIQLYTGLIYNGPFLASEICNDLQIKISSNRFRSWNEVVGSES